MEDYAASLAESRARLKELEEKGDAACSEYDLSNGYNAEFNKQLVRNHIAYYLSKMKSQGGMQFKLGDFGDG